MSDMLDATQDLRPRLRPETLDFLATRRSTPSKTLEAPGPDAAALEAMLTLAARCPDHGKLAPWRFILVEDAARRRLADAAERRAAALERPAEDAAKARNQLLEAPVMVVVVSAPRPSDKIPELEQLLSAGAVCLGLVSAALASGFGAQWLSGWIAHDDGFAQDALGLADGERVAGFIHIGTPRVAPPERPRPDIAALTTRLEA